MSDPSEITAWAAVWIATASLHRQHPERKDFSTKEIEGEVLRQSVWRLDPGTIRTHISQHCVATRRPNPNKPRVLFETGKGRRRLFRPGDPYDPKREKGPIHPDQGSLPERYRDLVDWYRKEYASSRAKLQGIDPILALRGKGQGLWADESPDDYVRRLREAWP